MNIIKNKMMKAVFISIIGKEMKQALLIICIGMLPLLLNAQNEDIKKSNDDWWFVAGITVYTNNNYIFEERILERQPIELNVRYKLKQHHALRFQFPFSWKVNMHGISTYELPFLNAVMNGNEENKAHGIWEGMKADNFNFVRTNQLYYSLFGASIGYDYDFKLKYNFSFFGGFDFSFNHLNFYTDYIGIDFFKLGEDNQSQLEYLEYTTNKYQMNCLSIKPLFGFRYFFQKKLLLECSIGYGFAFYNKSDGTSTVQFSGSDNIQVLPFWQRRDYKQVITQLSINYSF